MRGGIYIYVQVNRKSICGTVRTVCHPKICLNKIIKTKNLKIIYSLGKYPVYYLILTVDLRCETSRLASVSIWRRCSSGSTLDDSFHACAPEQLRVISDLGDTWWLMDEEEPLCRTDSRVHSVSVNFDLRKNSEQVYLLATKCIYICCE